MRRVIRKAAVIIWGSFLLSTGAFTQQVELNDPQIISVIETVSQIDISYGTIAINNSRNKTIEKFAQSMVDNSTKMLNQTIELENRLILSTQTNSITTFLLERKMENTKVLRSKKKRYFDPAYIDSEVSFYEVVVSVVRNTLIPQARNKQLKNYLAEIYPLLEQYLEAARKIQDKINK